MVPVKMSKEQRRQELQHILSLPNGMMLLYQILLARLGLPFYVMLPPGLPLIQTILAHEYPGEE